MLEIRLRVLDVRERETNPPSFLGIVEGFPELLSHAVTAEQCERDLVDLFEEHLKGLMNHEATRLQLDDFPTIQVVRLVLSPGLA